MAYSPKTTAKFNRVKKKLPERLRRAIDSQVKQICKSPDLGDLKTGPLAGIRVHKFGFFGQLYLLAYEVDTSSESILIYAVGGHENFYRDLERYLKS